MKASTFTKTQMRNAQTALNKMIDLAEEEASIGLATSDGPNRGPNLREARTLLQAAVGACEVLKAAIVAHSSAIGWDLRSEKDRQ